MEIVPVRFLLLLAAAALNVTVPFPEPAAPPVMVIQSSLLTVVHVHETGAVTAMLPVPPVRASVWLVGLIWYLQMTACDTVNVWPAMVIVPVRGADPELAGTVNCTVPFPVPDAPLLIVIHASLLIAAHEHDEAVVTAIETPAPPAAPIELLVGVMAKLHVTGGGAGDPDPI